MTPSTQTSADHADRPLVSVVIIFLNAERFIAEAIESVFAQTYDDWELLLVDDGSTDRSTEIARDCAQCHPRIVRYVEHLGHVNRGMSASRNAGLHHARGEFVALLDADDVWLPHKLDRQVGILRAEHRAGMVCGRSQYWHSWTKGPDDEGHDSFSELCGPPNALAEPPNLLRRWFAGRRTIASQSNVMFRRDLALRLGGFEDAFRGIFEDLAFTIKVYLREPVFVADECWDRIRRHPDSCVARASSSEWNVAWFSFLSWLERYLGESGLRGSEFWQPLQKELWPFRHPVLFRLARLQRRMSGLISPASRRKALQRRAE